MNILIEFIITDSHLILLQLYSCVPPKTKSSVEMKFWKLMSNSVFSIRNESSSYLCINHIFSHLLHVNPRLYQWTCLKITGNTKFFFSLRFNLNWYEAKLLYLLIERLKWQLSLRLFCIYSLKVSCVTKKFPLRKEKQICKIWKKKKEL